MSRDAAIIAAVVLISVASIPLLIHSDEGAARPLKRALGGAGVVAALALLIYWVAQLAR
jgi:hypothetical protein